MCNQRRVTPNDVALAKNNWEDWGNVFNHAGAMVDNPLLADQAVFNNFLAEYSVGRTIRARTRDNLRATLSSANLQLAKRLADAKGMGIDALDVTLSEDYAAGYRLRSAISKIAAFLVPEYFIAWDHYASRGIKIETGRLLGHSYETYAEYLADVNALLAMMHNGIAHACQGNYPQDLVEINRFHRRVLDVYLMRIGGRQY